MRTHEHMSHYDKPWYIHILLLSVFDRRSRQRNIMRSRKGKALITIPGKPDSTPGFDRSQVNFMWSSKVFSKLKNSLKLSSLCSYIRKQSSTYLFHSLGLILSGILGSYISFLTLLVCTLELLETLLYGLIFCLCLTVNDLLYEGWQIKEMVTLQFVWYFENGSRYPYEILTRP